MGFGIKMLAIAALVWCTIGILAAPLSPWWLLAPVAISGAILILRPPRRGVDDSAQDASRIGGLVRRWTIAQTVAIFAAVIILVALRLPHAIGPVAAMIVGLHFLPLAKGIPVPVFYLTGGAMIVVGVLTVATAPEALMLPTVAIATSTIMWLSAAVLLGGWRLEFSSPF